MDWEIADNILLALGDACQLYVSLRRTMESGIPLGTSRFLMGLMRLSASGDVSNGRLGILRPCTSVSSFLHQSIQRQLRLLCSLTNLRSSRISRYFCISSPNVCKLKLKCPQAAATSSKPAWIRLDVDFCRSIMLYTCRRASDLATLNWKRASVRDCRSSSLMGTS